MKNNPNPTKSIISYMEHIKNSVKEKWKIREELKEKIKYMNISEASRMLHCSRNTVYKLLKEKDLNYEAKKRPKKTRRLNFNTDDLISYHKQTNYGAGMIKCNNDSFIASESTIYRRMRELNLIKKERKWRRKIELAKRKKRLKVFEKLQLDTKYLTDINNLVDKNKPNFEYTLRDMKSGFTFLGYTNERSVDATIRFLTLCLYHLMHYGIDLHYTTIQSDNGVEFLGNVYKKEEYEISKLLNFFGCRFMTIPFRSPTYNSHVETFHGRIERECYDILNNEFYSYTKNFIINWNTNRVSYTKKKTTKQIIKEHNLLLDDSFYLFPPINLSVHYLLTDVIIL